MEDIKICADLRGQIFAYMGLVNRDKYNFVSKKNREICGGYQYIVSLSRDDIRKVFVYYMTYYGTQRWIRYCLANDRFYDNLCPVLQPYSFETLHIRFEFNESEIYLCQDDWNYQYRIINVGIIKLLLSNPRIKSHFYDFYQYDTKKVDIIYQHYITPVENKFEDFDIAKSFDIRNLYKSRDNKSDSESESDGNGNSEEKYNALMDDVDRLEKIIITTNRIIKAYCLENPNGSRRLLELFGMIAKDGKSRMELLYESCPASGKK